MEPAPAHAATERGPDYRKPEYQAPDEMRDDRKPEYQAADFESDDLLDFEPDDLVVEPDDLADADVAGASPAAASTRAALTGAASSTAASSTAALAGASSDDGEADASAGGDVEAAALTERELRILTFERQWWRHPGAKEQAIRDNFDLSATHYYQLLNGLLEHPAALAHDPMLVKRLRRLRSARGGPRLPDLRRGA